MESNKNETTQVQPK